MRIRQTIENAVLVAVIAVTWVLNFGHVSVAYGKTEKKKNSIVPAPIPMLLGSPKRLQLKYPELPPVVLMRKQTEKATVQIQPPENRDWALMNIGFFDLNLPQPATTREQCQGEVVVAVIDTGIDYTHTKLLDSLWVNSGESGSWEPPEGLKTKVSCRNKSCNGEDDDQNGFVDDVVGWDFVNDMPLPYDTHGHGTHVAGIVAASSGIGFAAPTACPGVKVMALKYYDSSGAGYNNLNNTVRAIYYAINNGAQIINYSGGGHDPAPAERAAIDEARKRGILFVAAAGNDGHNNDQIHYYPASYPLDNILGVASVNKNNQLLPSSNFGKSVHVAAPGLGILSTLPEERYGTMSGTSQATAFVTGAAALLAAQMKAKKQGFDYKAVKNWLVEGSLPLKGNESRALLAGGLLSLPRAVAFQRSDSQKNRSTISEIALNPNGKSKNKSQ